LKEKMIHNKLTMAYSFGPNDTFIFYALGHKKIDLENIALKISLHDVEYLNQQAKTGMFDITKLSFAAIGQLTASYGLLRSGGALGKGCGPLIVARKGSDLKNIGRKKIAVPGLWTTANLLLALFLSKSPEVEAMTFDEIMPAVKNGKFDYGVIIHEGRFTYSEYGLDCLMDLGKWWESETSLPIPLGGIAIRRDLPKEVIFLMETAIRESIQYSRTNPVETGEYVRANAQELSDDVISRHIDLYVNEYSMDVGTVGESAIETLFSKSRQKGLMPEIDQELFALK